MATSKQGDAAASTTPAAASGNSGAQSPTGANAGQGAGGAGAATDEASNTSVLGGAHASAGASAGAQGQAAEGQGQGQAGGAGQEAGGTGSAVEIKAADIAASLPQGVRVDEALLGSFLDTAKKAKVALTADSAKAFASWYAQQQAAQAEASVKQMQAQDKSWVETLKTDTDFGGTKFDGTVHDARRAVQRFGGEELRRVFEETGLGNHPDIVKAFARIGQAIREDNSGGIGGTGGANREDPQAALRRMYPSMFNADGTPKG